MIIITSGKLTFRYGGKVTIRIDEVFIYIRWEGSYNNLYCHGDDVYYVWHVDSIKYVKENFQS